MQHHKQEKLVHCVQCEGHSEGLYNQNMTISVVSSKLLVSLQPNLVWQYSIISWRVLLKIGITAFKVNVMGKVQNVSDCLSRCYFLLLSDCVCSVSPELLNHFLPNLVWCCIIMRQCVVRKNWFTVFNVKVTARAYIIKTWLCLLYHLKFWSVCKQAWYCSTAS